MKISIPLLNVVLAVIFSATLFGQTGQTGYHTVACFKVKSDKGADFITQTSICVGWEAGGPLKPDFGLSGAVATAITT